MSARVCGALRGPLLALPANRLTGELARVCGAFHGPLLALLADQLTGERARVCGALHGQAGAAQPPRNAPAAGGGGRVVD